MASTYQRIQHAGHYDYDHPRVGHDLEILTITSPTWPRVGPDMEAGYDFHHGEIVDGVQRWVFTRTAPLTGGVGKHSVYNRCRQGVL